MENDFSTYAKELIRNSKIKITTVASALGYDISYVSKWLNGSMLPSEKNIEITVASLSDCIINNIDEKNRSWFISNFGTTDKVKLRETLIDNLLQKYSLSKHSIQANQNTFYPIIGKSNLFTIISKYIEQEDQIVFIVDLLSLDTDSRLKIAGINGGRFIRTQYTPSKKIALTINMQNSVDPVYDGIYLIHLLSSLSLYDCALYSDGCAAGEVVFVVSGKLVITGFLSASSSDVSAVSIVENNVDSSILHAQLIKNNTNKRLVYIQNSIKDFIVNKYYIRSLLSTNIRWVIGHLTELFMPDELFYKYSNLIECNTEDLARIHIISAEIICKKPTMLLIYETAISDFIATGEIDFFNTKLCLNTDEKKLVLQNLIDFISQQEIKLIGEALFPEFKHLYSPNLYISDTVCYLRLENAYERDCIVQIVNRETIALFDNLYKELWRNREDIIIKDHDMIASRLKHYLSLIPLISN